MTLILETTFEKYVLNKVLGKGLTCECYIGNKVSSDNSESFAIKIFDQKYHKYYLNEVNILSKLSNNTNIIKLYSHGEGNISSNASEGEILKKKIYFEVMEYAENGELKDYISNKKTRIPEKISSKIFYRMVSVIKYLHENNITHCDIKPENILMCKNFVPKLNDFGFSHIFEHKNGEKDWTLFHFAGSVIYSGPEIRKAYTKGYNAVKNDIYSLGMLIFVITIGDFPFQKASFSDEKYKFIIKKNYDRFWECFNDIEISDEFKDLINKLICFTPNQRLDMDKILEHPWVKKYNNEIHDNNNYNKNQETLNEFENDIFDKDIFDEFKKRKV